ncbi:MAG: sigma-70 family RNA polymerase sigma factor [Anaerolineae bacterium]|nr:sigma-70 family RNA polymerase sigma factor [Anaerolineae bacterium]
MTKAMQISDPEEQQLIEQAQMGDRQAFADLVNRHRKGVINVAYRICGDAGQAEDIAQETFLRAWQHIPKYRPQALFRSWLYRIAANMTIDHLRSKKETVNIEMLALQSRDAGPELRLVEKERAAAVQQAVLGLPIASRQVLVLREYEQLSYQEIADTLEIPIGTVMSRLNYARKSIKLSLERMVEEKCLSI